MFGYGENTVDGIKVIVARRRAKRIGMRVKADGTVHITIPKWRGTLAEASAFFADNREWVERARARVAARLKPPRPPATESEIAGLASLLGELHARWCVLLGEDGVSWRMRRMKTRWGVCNWLKRQVTYATMLAGCARECVEYVVVHELTHLKAHGHGDDFKALMDARLPDWRRLRAALREAAP